MDMNLDTIIDSLLDTHEFQFPSVKEMDAFEQSNPHPDGKRWCVAEQTIGFTCFGIRKIFLMLFQTELLPEMREECGNGLDKKGIFH